VVAALIYTLSEVHDDAFYAGLAKQMANCPASIGSTSRTPPAC
jgi:hypothetical protein